LDGVLPRLDPSHLPRGPGPRGPCPHAEDASAVTDRTGAQGPGERGGARERADRKSTRLNSSHGSISYAVFCLKKTTQLRTKTRSKTLNSARAVDARLAEHKAIRRIRPGSDTAHQQVTDKTYGFGTSALSLKEA